MEYELYEKIYHILEEFNSSDAFLELEKKYNLILFGGAVRDFVFFPEQYEVRDLDFVMVGVESVASVKEILRQYFTLSQMKYNQFGGIKICTPQINFDIWRLEDTRAFQQGFMEAEERNLLKTVFLNIDAYAYHMNKKQYLDHCNENRFPTEIDVVLEDWGCLEVNLLRALVYAQKYEMPLSARLKQLLKMQLSDPETLERMKAMQLYHFKKEVFWLEQVREAIEYAEYLL